MRKTSNANGTLFIREHDGIKLTKGTKHPIGEENKQEKVTHSSTIASETSGEIEHDEHEKRISRVKRNIGKNLTEPIQEARVKTRNNFSIENRTILL